MHHRSRERLARGAAHDDPRGHGRRPPELLARRPRDSPASGGRRARPIALLGDLQGPKIRTGPLESAFIRLVRGRTVILTGESRSRRAQDAPSGDGAAPADNHIEISHPELVEALQRGDHVLLDDGRIELVVRSVEGRQAECSVVRGGLLGERKGVSVPGRPLPMPALTEKDLEDLKLAVELQVDWIALSFVRRPEDLLLCQKHLGDLACKVPVIAKLEKLEAIRNLSKILEVADAVMVARGDLGVELKLGDLPAVQKDVIDRANRAGVPVITATEMLESMVTSNRPTRAETSDVANAIWDGTDAVMLSQETSVGAHPVEAVRAMARICQSAERHPDYQGSRDRSGAQSRMRRPPRRTSWAPGRSSRSPNLGPQR